MSDEYAGLQPEFRRRLKRLAGSCGLTITSGYRSPEKQAQLYRDYLAGRGNPANPPGTSNHEFGLAADIAGNLDCAHAAARSVGIHFPVTGEPWHAQPVEVRSVRYTGNPFPPEPQREDDMGVYSDHSEGKNFAVPLVPAGAGASGGGYENHVYVSLSASSPCRVHTRLIGDGKVWVERERDLGEDRVLAEVCERVDNRSPSALLVTNVPAGVRIDYLVEWARPEDA